MTQDEFILYISRCMNMPVRYLVNQFEIVPCNCNTKGCRGWKMISRMALEREYECTGSAGVKKIFGIDWPNPKYNKTND